MALPPDRRKELIAREVAAHQTPAVQWRLILKQGDMLDAQQPGLTRVNRRIYQLVEPPAMKRFK
jgi:hypothetical protein